MVDTRFYDLLKYLGRGGSYQYYWTPDTDEGKLTFWFSAGKPKEVNPLWRSINVYFGVHPSRIEKAIRERAKIEDIEAVNCLFAEFDIATGQTAEHLLESIQQIDIPPSVIVFSGGGYHCYWLLEQTYHIDGEDARQRIIDIQYAWVDLTGSDGAAKDLARVLRVPGTFNRKPERGPKFPEAKIVKFDLDDTHSLDDFALLVEQIIEQTKAKRVEVANTDVSPVDLDDQTILEKMFQSDAAATALWAGDLTAQEDDHSDADLALCNKLAFWFGRDKQRIDRVFRRSNLFRPKWLRDDYRNKTIDKAIAGTTNTYTPAGSNLGNVQGLVAPVHANGASSAPPPQPAVRGASGGFDLFKYRTEDGGILDAWRDLFGNSWLYVTGYEAWYQWTATHWAKDECQNTQRQVQDLMDSMNRLAKLGVTDAVKRGDKIAEDIYKAYVQATKRTKGKVSSVEVMAQAQRAAAVKMLDTGHILNLRNGTLELDTLTLRPHSPADYLTYCLDYEYDPAATCPRFEQFLREVLVKERTDDTKPWESDTELYDLFQELLGYSLTTETKHEIMIWLSGDGGNGKTVLITIVQKLLGALCWSVDFQNIGLPGNYDLSEIPGKRVIFSTESERGGKVAEGYIKRIVSGEQINTRPIYGKNFGFNSVSKIWWAMNDKPIIKDTGNSIWRRLKLIPFNRIFTDQDKDVNLLSKLEAELPGILNFALVGLRRLRKTERFSESAMVTKAVQEYKIESNPVLQWMNERTDPMPAPTTVAATLHDDYRIWCSQNGRQPLNSTNFGNELRRLRIDQKHSRTGKLYALRIRP